MCPHCVYTLQSTKSLCLRRQNFYINKQNSKLLFSKEGDGTGSTDIYFENKHFFQEFPQILNSRSCFRCHLKALWKRKISSYFLGFGRVLEPLFYLQFCLQTFPVLNSKKNEKIPFYQQCYMMKYFTPSDFLLVSCLNG